MTDILSFMKILLISSEAVPFAKTGGLADVSGALPAALAGRNHECGVIMPFYREVKSGDFPTELVGEKIPVRTGNKEDFFNLRLLRREGVSVYFVEKDEYYDRDYLYNSPEGDYPDNAMRFGFFAGAVMASVGHIGRQDILHCNDWQSALIPFYVKNFHKDDELFKGTKILFTIHNLAYQGVFDKRFMAQLGIPRKFFRYKLLEFYGKLSFMKAGILYSDAVSTVSEGYAGEILTPEYGCGLDGVLRTRKKDLYGIVNGVDYSKWNPSSDKYLVKNYGGKDLSGKAECKKDVAGQFGITYSADKPLVAMITRLAEQKGVDLVADAMREIVSMGADFILLGTGEERYHKLFTELGVEHKEKIGVKIAFDNALAHKMEAGADIFLMPSRYEPCGLNQLYSLKYATVPVVRATGGLKDTIENFDPATGTGNGFKFEKAETEELVSALRKAMETFKNKELWETLLRNGMACDYSWPASAEKYEKLYGDLPAK